MMLRLYWIIGQLLSSTSCYALTIPLSAATNTYQRQIVRSIRASALKSPSASIEDYTERETLTDISSISSRLEPLLTSFLFRAVHDATMTTDTPNDEADTTTSHFRLNDAYNAIHGLVTWETSLRKGRLPLYSDFGDESLYWPEEPLFTHVYNTLSTLALPRLVRRHPEIITSVLLGIAKVVVEFVNLQRRGMLVIIENGDDSLSDDVEYIFEDDEYELQSEEEQVEYTPMSEDELEKLAQTLSSKLTQEWGGVVQGVSMLDDVFGYSHNMLDLKGQTGFGLQDGIWQHKGWEPLPSLQKQLSKMPQLRNLLSHLGRRQSTEGRTSKFAPRKRSDNPEDMLGVEIDRFDPTSVAGLCYSSSLTTMLPSEAVLLQSSRKALRLLFLAKKAESKLLSYDISGYTDINTKHLPQKRKSVTSPSAPGGPIIICLDTSWSMSGQREQLAKAVVLASVQAATRQGRSCRVVSFSSANNAIESGVLSCDAEGIRRLLDFLQSSFDGGTDVTGALKFAIEKLDEEMSSSDIILVSDGEIPNVSNVMMAKLESLRQHTGMEIHGLLVGKKESPALSTLCDSVHDFLVDYELLNHMKVASAPSIPTSSTALYNHAAPKVSAFKSSLSPFRRMSTRHRYNLSLHASRNSIPEDTANELTPTKSTGCKLQRKKEANARKKQRFTEDDEDWDWGSSVDEPEYDSGDSKSSASPIKVPSNSMNNEFVDRLEDTYESLQVKVSHELRKWSSNELDSEMKSSPLFSKRRVLSDSISFVEEGLIEREPQAILVVLGMISQEHVLFIGPPGTSKSELGRRLSQLCGGPFFQKLFTRFTTPEEIFGPLSLRALENDEYKRCIDGFLPTATVAFLDEIFKANSSILNTLLTILNERQFDNGSGERVICPLKCVIGASNELPESEELDALLDRFLLRAQVNPVSDDGLLQILSGSNRFGNPSTDIAKDLDQVVSEISKSIDAISLDQSICVLVQKLRTFARDELGMYISDRRLVKAARLLRVSAATHGRSNVDRVDCLLLEHIFWQLPEQQVAIREWLLDNLTPSNDIVEQSKFLLSGLASETLALVKKTSGDITGDSGARSVDVDAIKSVKKEIEQIQVLLGAHSDDVERHMGLVDHLSDHLWISQDSAYSAKQYLLPLASIASEKVNKVRMEAASLQFSLTDFVEDDLRSSLIELLVEDEDDASLFTEDELSMNLKEAKRMYDGETLRKWKSARRKINW